MAIHSSPYNSSPPIWTKTKNLKPDENPSQKVFPIVSSNKSVSVTKIWSPKSPPYQNLSQWVLMMRNNRKIYPFSHKLMKTNKFPVKSIAKQTCQKLPPFGSINTQYMMYKDKSSKNFSLALKLKPLNFTSNIVTSSLILT